VELASNSVEGLRAFQRQKPDPVICGMMMPQKEGGDTIRLLRELAPDIKIIAISGSSTPDTGDLLSKATKLGAAVIIANLSERKNCAIR
jgi:CheY-like chemotaxis protein